jgi:hypothetical protein
MKVTWASFGTAALISAHESRNHGNKMVHDKVSLAAAGSALHGSNPLAELSIRSFLICFKFPGQQAAGTYNAKLCSTQCTADILLEHKLCSFYGRPRA